MIVPVAGGVTSRGAGRTLSVPEADVALTVADDAADGDVTAVALGDALPPVVAALALAVPPVPLAAGASLGGQLAVGPTVQARLRLNPRRWPGPWAGAGRGGSAERRR